MFAQSNVNSRHVVNIIIEQAAKVNSKHVESFINEGIISHNFI